MKRIFLALVAVAAASALQAGQPNTGITGTKHDLSATGYKTTTNQNQICNFCHTPHNAVGSVSGGDIAAQLIPLWNHTTTSATFTMYNSANNPISDLQGAVDATPTGVSLACLSCHDGTVAVGSVVNAGITNEALQPVSYATSTGHVDTTTGMMYGSAKVGTDLTNDHPISIVYNVADTGLWPVATAEAGGIELYAGKVQCASCHEVHDAHPTAGQDPFLRVSMIGSQLCKTCHNK